MALEKFLEREDLINGRFGEAVADIEGERVTLFFLKNITAKVDIDRTDIPRLGTPINLSTGGDAKGTWEATMYSHTKAFRKIAKRYMHERKETSIDIILTQDDPNFAQGSDTVILKNCYLETTTIFQLDVEASELEEDISGTFENFEER